MDDQQKSGVGRKSLASRRKAVVNPFPPNIGEYHETHPLGGGTAEPVVPARETPAPEQHVTMPAPVETFTAATENGQQPAQATATAPMQPIVAPVVEQPAQEVAQAPVPPTVAPAVVPAAPVQQPVVVGTEPASVQVAPATPVEPPVASVATPAGIADAPVAAAPEPVAESDPPAAPVRRSDAPRLSEMKPVPVAPLGEGLFDAYVTGRFIDYPVGVRYEDYIDLNFDQGYNKSFRRMEARVSPLIEDWLEKIARKINDQSRLAGSSKHLNDTRMRNNAVLRTALEKGLRELNIDGATSEASLRAINDLPPAPEQGLFNTFLRDKLRQQQEEFDE